MSASAAARRSFPLQAQGRNPRERASINGAVYMRAYEVYCEVFGPQPALIKGDCRGGFSAGEVIAFLYASGFPRTEWSARVDEALDGMNIGTRAP